MFAGGWEISLEEFYVYYRRIWRVYHHNLFSRTIIINFCFVLSQDLHRKVLQVLSKEVSLYLFLIQVFLCTSNILTNIS